MKLVSNEILAFALYVFWVHFLFHYMHVTHFKVYTLFFKFYHKTMTWLYLLLILSSHLSLEHHSSFYLELFLLYFKPKYMPPLYKYVFCKGTWPFGLWRCKGSVSLWSERLRVRVPQEAVDFLSTEWTCVLTLDGVPLTPMSSHCWHVKEPARVQVMGSGRPT